MQRKSSRHLAQAVHSNRLALSEPSWTQCHLLYAAPSPGVQDVGRTFWGGGFPGKLWHVQDQGEEARTGDSASTRPCTQGSSTDTCVPLALVKFRALALIKGICFTCCHAGRAGQRADGPWCQGRRLEVASTGLSFSHTEGLGGPSPSLKTVSLITVPRQPQPPLSQSSCL